MNLIAAADDPLPTKIAYFLLVFMPSLAFILYAVAKSRRLSDFLDAMPTSGSAAGTSSVLLNVWKHKRVQFDRDSISGQ